MKVLVNNIDFSDPNDPQISERRTVTFEDGTLSIEGSLPAGFNGILEKDDVDGMTGPQAEAVFYLIAIAKQGSYVDTTYEGITLDQVKSKIRSLFNEDFAEKVIQGYPINLLPAFDVHGS